jgi:phage terminase small subunit
MSSNLNYKQQLFVNAYCAEAAGNSVKAANIAGYKNQQTGRHLLLLPKIQERITQLQEQRLEQMGMDRTEILTALAEIARAKITDFINKDGSITIHDRPNERAVEAIEVVEYLDGKNPRRITRIKLRSPIEAMDKICRITGLYTPEKHDVDFKNCVLVIQ